MIKSKFFKGIYVFLLFLIYFQINSCTVIGFFIGRQSDDSKLDSLLFDISQFKKIEPESEVFVFLRNGDNINGIFKTVESKAPEESMYAELKRINHNSENMQLPIPGDTKLTLT
ncbi:hypothetical protein ACFLSX_01460 [Calditrichota bacterium]